MAYSSKSISALYPDNEWTFEVNTSRDMEWSRDGVWVTNNINIQKGKDQRASIK